MRRRRISRSTSLSLSSVAVDTFEEQPKQSEIASKPKLYLQQGNLQILLSFVAAWAFLPFE
jgi:hypothetical protein